MDVVVVVLVILDLSPKFLHHGKASRKMAVLQQCQNAAETPTVQQMYFTFTVM